MDVLFRFGSDHVLVRIDGTTVLFGNTAQGPKMATIDGIRLSKEGVIKEFPDLKDAEDWRIKAIERFKIHISTLGSEKERIDYIISDLKKWGYVPVRLYRGQGYRPEVIK